MNYFIGLLIVLVALLIIVTTARRMARDRRADNLRVFAAVIGLMMAQIAMKAPLFLPGIELEPGAKLLVWNVIDLLTLLTLSALVKLASRKHRDTDEKKTAG